jgi:predicted amidohydrolase
MLATDRLKISLAQLDPTVGDIAGNAAKLVAALATARAQGADLLVTSELYLAGIPAEDLVLRPDFQDAIGRAVEGLKAATVSGPGLLVGAPWRHEGKLHNAALLLDRGELRAVRFKHDLPQDEQRLFAAGPAPGPMAFRGVRLGVMIGRDMASPDAAETLEESGAQLLMVLNGSPFEAGGLDARLQLALERVQESGLALLAVNPVGGQDDLVFDGGSFALDRGFRLRVQAPCWQEAIVATEWTFDDDERWVVEPGPMTAPEEGMAALYQALVLGLRGYVTKNGWARVSVDPTSALVEAIARDAVGDRLAAGGGESLALSALDKTAMATGQGRFDGGYAVLRDVYRTTAYELARWCRVPMEAPTAETVERDEILTCLVERELGLDAIVARGHARETVIEVWRMLDRAEYKRRQAPPGVKTTRRTFGRDRRYPITNNFKAGE